MALFSAFVSEKWLLASFTLDFCVQGYHAYKDISTSPTGEILTCKNEFGNIVDPYAVAVVSSSDTIVGHVPRSISAVCYFFITL